MSLFFVKNKRSLRLGYKKKKQKKIKKYSYLSIAIFNSEVKNA